MSRSSNRGGLFLSSLFWGVGFQSASANSAPLRRVVFCGALFRRVFLLSVVLIVLADSSLVHAATGNGPLGSTSGAAFDDELIRRAVGNLFELIEGAFGALLMVGAGLVALVYAAMGSYRNALSMLIVAVAAFILRSLVSLFFGTDFPSFSV